jgi:histidine kinase/DNA gyrase B/HSP90-like ATPase
MPRVVNKSPKPKSHIKTLMRIGYNLDSAVADIIDNSIAAEAKNIEILSPPGEDEPVISILDDGCGMNEEELIQNMRIACKDPDEERKRGDLGRFGSGLKTASFSQARQLTVISKKEGYPLCATRWDIDNIESTNEWCLEVFDRDEVEHLRFFDSRLKSHNGTQVIWSKLTCIDRGSHAEDHDSELATKLSELKGYIALYFHRFMTGSDKRVFSLNRSSIEPIDPFMTNSKGYQEGPSERLRCKGGYIYIQTHVLPHFKNMDLDKMEKLGGADGIAQKQGIYIYREKRLISAGGWMNMARSSQLGALARVQVDIPSSLDKDWSTDVKKASLQVPPRVRRELKKFLSDPVKRSRRIHRYRGVLDTANGFWKICEDENNKIITYQIDTDNETLTSILSKCNKEAGKMLINYLRTLAASLPINHIYEKMSERPKDINQDEVNMDKLESLMNKVFEETE